MVTMYELSIYVIGTVVSLCALTLLYYIHAFQFWKKLRVPHAKPSFPFGNFDSQFATYLGQHIENIYSEGKRKGLKFCGYYMFAMPVFVPISPDMVKDIMSKNFESFHDRGFHSDEKNDPMACSLITISGERWKTMRTKLSPTFSTGKIKSMFPLVAACTHDLDNILEEATRKSEPIDIYDLSNKYAVDVICSVAFGLEGDSLKNPNSVFMNHARLIFARDLYSNFRLCLAVAAPALLKLFKIQFFNTTVTRFFRKVVHDTVEYRENNGVLRKDLIDILIRLKNNENMDDDDNTSANKPKKNNNSKSLNLTVDQIAAHCFLFLAAGFETSSTVISFCMFELAFNLEIQEKVRAEVISVLKNYNGEMNYEALSELRYLDKVIDETLRKYPPAHTLNRLCTQDYRIPETDIIIRKGTRASISSLGIHHDPEFYPDPEKFDPERFTEEEKSKRINFTYIPFGGGPRICPGYKFGLMETKLCISGMLKKYKFSLHPKVKLPLRCCTVGPVINTVEPILLQMERI